MRKMIMLLVMSLAGTALALAQQPQRGNRASEAQETLRFMRLAETKKNLDLSDEKLLALNDVLDDFEEERFNLTRERRKLHLLLQASDRHDDEESERLVEAFMANKKRMLASELSMVERVKEVLSPREVLQFLVFYERFQRDVQRRVRMLQRGADKFNGKKRRRN